MASDWAWPVAGSAADLKTFLGLHYLGDESEEDIYAGDGPLTIPREIVWDTGCGNHVADRADLKGYAVEPSPGSRRGQTFTDAGGGHP